MEARAYVYILASQKCGTLYIGVTNNIARRVLEHRRGEIPGFTQKYKVSRLVHVEPFDRMYDAIAREKQLKHWNRAWKMRLIEETNPHWRDLFDDINR